MIDIDKLKCEIEKVIQSTNENSLQIDKDRFNHLYSQLQELQKDKSKLKSIDALKVILSAYREIVLPLRKVQEVSKLRNIIELAKISNIRENNGRVENSKS